MKYVSRLAAVVILTAACSSGSSNAYDAAFAQLYAGTADGFAHMRTQQLVQVGADSGMPEVHYATSVTLPQAKACYSDGEGTGTYAQCVFGEDLAAADAAPLFALQRENVARNAKALGLSAVPASGSSSSAAAWTSADGRAVIVMNQPTSDGKSTVLMTFQHVH